MSGEAPSSFIDVLYKEIGENDLHQDVKDYLSTGFLPLNKAISGRYAGGFPVGRIIEIFGQASCGKTLLATMAITQTQAKGGIGVYLDYEHAFSLAFAKRLGLQDARERWIYKQPATAEAGFKAMDAIVTLAKKSDVQKPITVIVDSVSAMLTEYELSLGAGNSNMKSNLSLPAVMSAELKKVASLISGTNVTLIFLNQVRDNPGVMFGSSEKTSGGNALKFYASLRIQLRKGGKIKDGDRIIGENVTATAIKNKCYQPFLDAEYQTDLIQGGINLKSSHLEAAIDAGLITQSGSWFDWDGQKMQGKGKVLEALEDPAEYKKILALFKDEEKTKGVAK